MKQKEAEDLIQFLTKFGLNDSHILHNKDIIAKEFIECKDSLDNYLFLCGSDRHGCRRCSVQCIECIEIEKHKYCNDCGDYVKDGCDNKDCKDYKIKTNVVNIETNKGDIYL